MPITLTESFRVNAPIERVWSYLTDPRQVAACLPGAEITEMESARAFRGAVKVKVGPVTATYKGRAELAEVDASRHLVRVVGNGRESTTGGADTAALRMTSTLRADGGATEVRVDASVDLGGRLMQFGRGMVEQVSRQLFAQFATCVRTVLETPVTAGDLTNRAPPAPARPLRAFPLVLHAMWSAILRAFRRKR